MPLVSNVKKWLYLTVAHYFCWWAGFSLHRWNPRVIVVTGSVGKTTMLHLLELEIGDRAHYSHDANSIYGIAFDILGMRGITDSRWHWIYLFVMAPWQALRFTHNQEFYVVEVDGERPSEATTVAKWLEPELSLWVSVANSHAVYFDSQVSAGLFPTVEEAIAHEFGNVVRHTTKLALYDKNNKLMRNEVTSATCQTIGVDGQPDNYRVAPERTGFTIDDATFIFSHPMPIELTIQLQMLKIAISYLDLPLQTNMEKFRTPPGRNSHFRGKKGINIIDSSYNAHLISMRSTIDMVKAMESPHTWLVLGDMIEQGESESDEHRKLGQILATTDCERIVLIGRRLNEYTLPVLEHSGLAEKVTSFKDTHDALGFIEGHITGKETILFKGSQYLEWLVEKLLADPSDAQYLARQEPAARRRREARGLL